MDIEVKDICGKFKEIKITEYGAKIEMGTLDKEEAKEIAVKLINAAAELLAD